MMDFGEWCLAVGLCVLAFFAAAVMIGAGVVAFVGLCAFLFFTAFRWPIVIIIVSYFIYKIVIGIWL